MTSKGLKRQIMSKIEAQIKTVRKENGYNFDINYVEHNHIKTSLDGLHDSYYPYIQIIDLNKSYNYQHSFSLSRWILAIELYLQKNNNHPMQELVWDLQEDVSTALKQNPQLGLDFVQNLKLIDEATDLGLGTSNQYWSVIGVEISYREPVRVY